MNILYYDTYKKMGFLDCDMKVENIYIYGFEGESIRVKGTNILPMTLGGGALFATYSNRGLHGRGLGVVSQCFYRKVVIEGDAGSNFDLSFVNEVSSPGWCGLCSRMLI